MTADGDTADALMYDAIESALWQDLADALNRLSEYGLDPIAGLCEQLGAKPTAVIDAGGVIHGGGVREENEGYRLRYRPAFTFAENGQDMLPFGWIVEARSMPTAETPA
jgi:hypothetical protein